MKKVRFRFVTLIIGFMILGCASLPENPQLKLMSVSAYEKLAAKNTRQTKNYDGFMNTMDLSATLLNSEMLLAQADQSARVYQWTPEQYQTERNQLNVSLQKEAQIFLSFFIPERKYDDLAKNNTKWKIFLDAGGRRFEGKATRLKNQLAELLVFYPQHTRWQTAYRISFPVPMTLIEKETIKLTITGPVGSATVDFQPN